MTDTCVLGASYSRNVFPPGFYQGGGRWGPQNTAQKYPSVKAASEAAAELRDQLPQGADEVVVLEYTED